MRNDQICDTKSDSYFCLYNVISIEKELKLSGTQRTLYIRKFKYQHFTPAFLLKNNLCEFKR